MTKEYDQQVESLQKGLRSLSKIIETTSDRKKYEKAILAKEIQQERINFFKIGYNTCKNEVSPQKKIGCSPLRGETLSQEKLP